MNPTLRSITEQFPYWRGAAVPAALHGTEPHVLLGCGTSYYIAQSVAAALNVAGVPALAVPGSEWLTHPDAYTPAGTRPHVIAFSRSGESTETVQAARASQERGQRVTALTCEAGSSLTTHADTVLYMPTHPEEGIVMTSSASLMLLTGLRLAGLSYGDENIRAAEALLEHAQTAFPDVIAGRTHFVFLGAGELYGIAQEGALKLQEMSLTYTQAYHPMEYRHGPVSLVDERTVIVLLSHPGSVEAEATLVGELRSKGARVIGFGVPGDLTLDVQGTAMQRAVTVLPALQMLGECVAQAKGLDTTAPRWLTKVVTIA
ncbi:glucosamine--fructose-6-phosphate aminotransferase (isomerizing) [Deinococcus metalli]|uniref:Glucosamine--fructose-6-phosphate aminotransferase n=1 Tax=Deinococcus metalli TaxID=1141878 RepID=A0A7W8NND5_9DEIO|nr:SIS domain-containing protein [Deinococcus metalli]MBB5375636.1 glucosamine--fructose-6-phosphate aminotransferase (isomerizing) [Deinococcus metalli]GHF38191.1 glucosamine--fructose-6-phosphate aminotransferase [Deinococcus metalli]